MKQYLIIPCFLFILCIGGSAGFCQEPEQASPDADRVHYGDVIDVDFVGGFEFDWRGTLTPEGYLDGLDGFSGEPVYGLCRTEAEISSDVARLYRAILREPKIAVKIIDRSNRAAVRLEGAIRTPTRFSVQRRVVLRELLVLAGGLTDGASGDITIFRLKNLSCRPIVIPDPNTGGKTPPQDNGSQTLNIKITELLTGNAAANPQILSGDMITVTRASPFYVIGAVNNPGPLYSHSEITASRAVAMAGGLAKNGDGGKVSIFRREGGGTSIIEADLDKIKRNETRDEVLKPFDIIDVAARGGGKRKYPPAAVSDENAAPGKAELPLKVID